MDGSSSAVPLPSISIVNFEAPAFPLMDCVAACALDVNGRVSPPSSQHIVDCDNAKQRIVALFGPSKLNSSSMKMHVGVGSSTMMTTRSFKDALAGFKIPNSLGLLFSITQLLLHAIYYKSTKRQIAEKKMNGEVGLTDVVVSDKIMPPPTEASNKVATTNTA